jgi:hypothetical protein
LRAAATLRADTLRLAAGRALAVRRAGRAALRVAAALRVVVVERVALDRAGAERVVAVRAVLRAALRPCGLLRPELLFLLPPVPETTVTHAG